MSTNYPAMDTSRRCAEPLSALESYGFTVICPCGGWMVYEVTLLRVVETTL
jgi:hypothetical protein